MSTNSQNLPLQAPWGCPRQNFSAREESKQARNCAAIPSHLLSRQTSLAWFQKTNGATNGSLVHRQNAQACA